MADMPSARESEVEVPPLKHLGPGMRALTSAQRRFVIAYIRLGCSRGVGTQAAVLAGIGGKRERSRERASKLLHDPKIIAAITEMVKSLEGPAAWRAQARLAELVDDDDPDVALKASVKTLEFTGHMVKRTEVSVTHRLEQMTLEELQAHSRAAIEALNPAERQMLGLPGPQSEVLDAEFAEVEKDPVADAA